MNRLDKFEKKIAKLNKDRFLKVGKYLKKIQVGKLYTMANYTSFSAYVKANSSKLGMGRRYALRYIAAYRVWGYLQDMEQPPTMERQVSDFY